MIVSRQSSLYCASSIASQLAGPLIFVENRTYLYVSVCTGNLLALSVGMAFAWSSPFIPKLTTMDNPDMNPIGRAITLEEVSWIGSFLSFGGMFGTFAAGYLSAKIGRKRSLILTCALPFIMAYILLANAKSVSLIYCARIIAGFSLSGIYTILPLYLGEIAEDSIRGFVCSSIMTFETLGELFTFCVGPYISIFAFCTTSAGITSTVALLIFIFLPESPYFLLSINDRQKAEKSLMKLRSNTAEGVRNELDYMQAIVLEAGLEQGTIWDIFKSRAGRKAETITIGITIFQHFSGIIPIVIYSQSIFKETGTTLPPEFCSMAIGVVQFLSSFVAPNFSDRLGRRLMLFLSSCGMLVAEFFLGLYFYFKDAGHDMSAYFWLPVTCLIMFLLCYVAGIGPLLWTIMSEVFQPNFKSAAFTFGVWLWWTLAFIMSRSFYAVANVFGMAFCFWCFSGSCFISAIFSLTVVVETRGKSFAEIHQLLSK